MNNILVDNCRIENNRQAGITITGQHKLVVAKSVLQGNGRRIGAGVKNTPNPGDGLSVNDTASAKLFDTLISNNAGAGIRNTTGLAARVTLFKVANYFNSSEIIGPFVIASDHNYSN